MARIKNGPLFSRSYEAMAALADQSLSDREALEKAYRLVRRNSQRSQAFVFGMGAKFRAIKREDYFERDQLARWADDGGISP